MSAMDFKCQFLNAESQVGELESGLQRLQQSAVRANVFVPALEQQIDHFVVEACPVVGQTGAVAVEGSPQRSSCAPP